MDLLDQMKQLGKRIEQIKDRILTEEATKSSLILPFVQMLGYDVFNPMELIPEFTADVGIKKGEKVDYAIQINDEPAILIEAKWCGVTLTNQDSQLFRYFGTTSAKFAILTNGIIYRFYTDLDESNKMDLTPFMEIDLLNIKENLVPELKKFSKTNFDMQEIFSSASDLKYTNLIKQFLAKQYAEPDDEFVSFVLSNVYSGRKTQQVVDRFRDIVKRSFSQYINDVFSDKLKSVMVSNDSRNDESKSDEVQAQESNESIQVKSRVNTTQEELEAYAIIKALLRTIISPDRITYRDYASYFVVTIDSKDRKWICRLNLDQAKKYIQFNNELNERISIETVDDIYDHKDKLEAAVRTLLPDENNVTDINTVN